MTMGWMETIRFIGLDLQVATVLAVGIVAVVVRILNSAWHRISSGAIGGIGGSSQGQAVDRVYTGATGPLGYCVCV